MKRSTNDSSTSTTIIRFGCISLTALVSGCASSDLESRRAVSSGASWTQNLNERPPVREPAGDSASAKADLNAARDKALR